MFGNKKSKENELLIEIQEHYKNLNENVKHLYKFHNCPKCGGNLININVISPSGNSVEYSCENCGEIMACTLVEGGNPKKAIHLQNIIKTKLGELYELIGEEIHKRNIDIAFKIN
jgi:predicted RNA-binding Zn-ribbon protein involved in translation (DUF1610 family)